MTPPRCRNCRRYEAQHRPSGACPVMGWTFDPDRPSSPSMSPAAEYDGVASRLATLRRRAGLTQPALASASGIGQKKLSSFETGRRVSTLRVADLERIVAACGTTMAQFFAEGADCRDAQAAQSAARDRRAVARSGDGASKSLSGADRGATGQAGG